jgi:hypothetical protein
MAVLLPTERVSIMDADGEPASYNGKTDARDGFSAITGGGFGLSIAIERSEG